MRVFVYVWLFLLELASCFSQPHGGSYITRKTHRYGHTVFLSILFVFVFVGGGCGGTGIRETTWEGAISNEQRSL